MSQAGIANIGAIPLPPSVTETLTGNDSVVVSPIGNNINVVGATLYTTAGNAGTATLTVQPRPNAYPITPYVVGPVGAAGYQTVQSGLNAANAAGGGVVYVQPGTYTENLTLFGNTEVVGTPGNSDFGTTGNTVVIVGVHTPPTSNSFTFSNISLQSATHIFNSALGGSANLVIENCIVQIANGYIFNLPSWTGELVSYNIGDVSTNNGVVNNTGGSTCFLVSATHGAGSANPMITSGPVIMQEIDLNCPWNATTGTTVACDYVIFTNTVTCANNSTGAFNFCRFTTGANPALTMSSSGAIKMSHAVIDSSNDPAISGAGAGTFTYEDLVFLNNSTIAGTLTTTTVSWQPYSRAIAATDATKVGTCSFNSAQFTVDSNGFVSAVSSLFPWIDQAVPITLAINTGYFVTAGTTQTLPAAPSQGNVVKIVADTANPVLIRANVGQRIRLGSLLSSSGGSMTSSLQGDSMELVFRAASSTWISIADNGVWVGT